MKKYTYFGRHNNMVCILRSLVDFDTLIANASEIEPSDFVECDGTNWGGHDTIVRTCMITGLKPTGRSISLKEPIVFSGTDFDMGMEYPWRVQVDSICEVST